MIDEAVLVELLAKIADEIPIPDDGPEHVLQSLAVTSKPSHRARPRLPMPLVAAVVAVVVALVAIPMLHVTSGTSSKSITVAASPAVVPRGAPADARALPPGLQSKSSSAPGNASPGPLDAAKIVKTGTLDLQVPHATMRVAVNRVSGVAVGLGGYVADSKTSYGGSNPTAQVTIRIPVHDFETAIAHLDAVPGVTVLGESENGVDVTAQAVDLQAQLTAATGQRDALLVVLSRAQTIGDILAVRDRVTAAETEVDQLQSRINVVNDQATFSSLAVTLSEKSARTAAVHHAATRSGLAKSWSDARHGFSIAIEWLIARSGAALIIVLAALALLFGLRYLYPVVRRGLL